MATSPVLCLTSHDGRRRPSVGRWRLRSVVSQPNRKRLVAVILGMASVNAVRAQVPYPTTAAPAATWGGYAMPDAVPYQPTLSDGCLYPASGPVSAEGGVGQPYPPAEWANPATVPPGPDVAFPDQLQTGIKKPWFPPGARNGVFQKVNFTGSYLPRFEDDALGMSDLELDVVFGLPFLTRDTPLLVTPFYGVHFLEGPDMPDVPPRLHDAAITLQHVRPLNDQWLVLLDLTLGEFADDSSFDSSDAFRITGGGAAVYRSSDVWKWVLGAEFVDRANTDVLPVAGFVYTPNDDVEYKLVFPTPKISWRLPWTDVPGQDERWAYVAGEFGGGAWAVTRASGASDQLDITDWRIFIGYERKIVGGLSRRIELGYVFGRTLEYGSAPNDEFSLDDTLMLRAGLTY
jgi:Domain of unknown function (DUF6268)